MDWFGRNVLVVGLGLSGLSMARWLSVRGARVRVIDTRETPPCALQLAAELPEVTETTGALCRAAGLETIVAGNIGIPVLDTLLEIEAGKAAPDVFVLELSSFQ